MKRILFFVCLACLLLLAASVSTTYDLSWFAITGGGGSVVNGIYSLDSAIGQPTAGLNTAGRTQLCIGFLCKRLAGSTGYLPFVKK